MELHTRKAGDVGRPIRLTFPAGTNLAGAVVKLQVVDQRSGVVHLDKAMVVTSTGSVEGQDAKAEYAPLAGELDALGLHRLWAQVTYAGGAVETSPTPGSAWLLVETNPA